jgi:hypothetical protein
VTFDGCRRSDQTSPEIPRHLLGYQDCAWPVLSHSHSAVDPITAIAWWRCLLTISLTIVFEIPGRFSTCR